MTNAIDLYGAPRSTCTRRVALIAKERNIPYNLTPVDLMKGEHTHASYREHQPFGQVPYITHDGFELFESRAIGRYLATLGSGTELVPTEPRARAKFEQAASIEYTQFDPVASTIAYEKVFKKYLGQETNEPLVTELVARLNSKLDAYEVILGKQKYLAGEAVTLADLYHLPYGTIIFEHLKLGGLDGRPNVQRWWKDITSRPTWQAVKDAA
ncbi:glutathione transferase [Lactarius akahatsu]|uniref:glutathione transferase n=1 Tax=Lactarius akahatsu TaxID=416441 RepID=A0AAD4L502_9AGAM|nr:glutathione transferase [Lactarius akahatsu]